MRHISSFLRRRRGPIFIRPVILPLRALRSLRDALFSKKSKKISRKVREAREGSEGFKLAEQHFRLRSYLGELCVLARELFRMEDDSRKARGARKGPEKTENKRNSIFRPGSYLGGLCVLCARSSSDPHHLITSSLHHQHIKKARHKAGEVGGSRTNSKSVCELHSAPQRITLCGAVANLCGLIVDGVTHLRLVHQLRNKPNPCFSQDGL